MSVTYRSQQIGEVEIFYREAGAKSTPLPLRLVSARLEMQA